MRLSGKIFLLLILFGGLSSEVWGQASVNVSPFDYNRVYRDIDKLVGHGLIDKIIMGQRPFSRRQVADFTAQAMRRLPELEAKLNDPEISERGKQKIQERLDYIDPIMERLKTEFQEELIQLGVLSGKTKWYSVHLVDEVDADVTLSNSLPRGIPFNGLGEIDAVINPLLQYRQGRHLVDGANLSLETTTWLRASNHFAFYVQPRFQLAIGWDGQPSDNQVFLNNLYGKIFVKNFEIEVGRDNLFYGQGEEAGLILSNNPRGLDMVKISNDIPFFFPWVFKYIGANKISFFYADLGPEQNFPNAYLVGYKWSIQPLSFFELGGTVAVHGGGEGSPPASFGDRVIDIFPFTAGSAIQISNKFGGIDARFRVPPARGLELYGEIVFDDTRNEIVNFLKDDTGYLAGFYLPRVTNSGTVDLRLEFHKTGERFYRHGQFISGWTLNQFIMGDNLGPDALGAYLTTNWDVNLRNLITFFLAFESRSNDIFQIDITDFSFIKVQDNPEERRYRAMVQWLHRVKGLPMEFFAQLGYEQVQNFNFIEGDGRANFLGRLNLKIHLDEWTRFPRKY